MFECHLNTLLFTSLNATLSYNELAEWSGDATTFAAAPLCFAVSNDPGYLCPLAGIVSPCQSNPLQEAYHMSRNEGILAIVMTRVQSYDINTSVCDYPAQPAGCYVEDLDTGALDLVTANIVGMGPFSFYTWHFLYHWTKGYRDVLSFEGDVATITVRMAVLYVVSHRGRVEALNLLKLNHVEGDCPMLTLRAISAICLLSTSQLALVQSDHGWYSTKFESMLPQVVGDLQTIIVSAEVCWHTYILNDVLSVVTKGYTRHYCHGAPAAHRAVDGPD
ncbi:hypothetical protein DYB28_008330 [Aphanomyces astaci]|uniref:Uncharacterized protein n=1 Tax=Aphanomyces astaci TaxID=112090 RepID=A0A9X8E6P1_APHAT|nr:hypothetical protein DYB28_008330 [Aphanomyces astaci]